MKKDIYNYNNKGQFHGYHENYVPNEKYDISFRGNYKNGRPIAYIEWHWLCDTDYYIR